MKDSQGDDVLLTCAAQGDVAAAGARYDRHGAVIYALAITVTGQANRAGPPGGCFGPEGKQAR